MSAGRIEGRAVPLRDVPPVTSNSEAAEERSAAPARFSLLYESQDARLCVFEDAEGHLSAVDARRLA